MGHNTDGSINLTYPSNGGGVFVITLDGGGLGQGPNQPCSSFSVKPESGQTITFNIASAANADANCPPLDAAFTPFHYTNTNLIRFFGTGGKHVYGFWRN